MKPEPFRIVCLNRTQIREDDDDTFNCSLHGQLVARECCIECETRSLETPKQKIERQIKLNNRLLEYHQSEIGRIRLENLKLSDSLIQNGDKK
jgi:hypothetical protein